MRGQREKLVGRRVLAAGFAWILASGAFPAQPAAGAGSEPEAGWPVNVQVIEAQLRGFALEKFDQSLPQLRAFDREGRQVFSMSGYNRDDLDAALPVVLRGQAVPPTQARTLAKELALVSSTAGRRLGAPPAADVTVVEYWAEWCGPCRILSRNLREHFAAHPEVRITLVHIEADPSKFLKQQRFGSAESRHDPAGEEGGPPR